MMKPFPASVEWVFLDLDNTLWDFDANANEALKELYRRHNLHLHSDFHVDQFVLLYQDVNAAYWKRYERGEVTKEVLRTARFTDTFDLMGVPAALQPTDVWQEYLDICPLMTQMMPQALESLALLSQRYKLALLTNGFEATQQTKIRCSGIEPFIRFMVTSESLGVAKPNKAFFDHALFQAGCAAPQAVYLGDTWDTDVVGGLEAGILTYWYRRGQAPREESHPLFGGVIDDLMGFAQL
ncbi:MAG: YjjG family noncanonical pyrimidine nucleotidase [Bacteroidota bacterium]